MNNQKVNILRIIFLFFVCMAICLTVWTIITKNKKKFLLEMASDICENGYTEVFSNDNYLSNGIFEDNKNHYVYYIKNMQKKAGFYQAGGKYEFGYVYNDFVEKYFKDAVYFYRESRVSGISNELKIAFEADNEDELITKYGHNLYEFVKDLNSEYKKDVEITVYYNDSLSGINTTYDKLFLYASYNTNNVTQAFGFGGGNGNYVFYDIDPIDILNSIFSNKDNYPENSRNAIKFHRHIRTKINNGQDISENTFINQLKNSFEESY